MMHKIYSPLILSLLAATALGADKSIPELILDLGVESSGNSTCNTASGVLVRLGDQAVPALKDAIDNTVKKIRYHSVRTLGEINTGTSRKALISAYSNRNSDMRGQIAYALSWHPKADAESVYIDYLGEASNGMQPYLAEALGEIKSKKALPLLQSICQKPKNWRCYYSALTATRSIEDKTLSKELANALGILKEAKFSTQVLQYKLEEAVAIIKTNLKIALPDVFNIFMYQTKGYETKAEPNAKSILRDAGSLAYPYIRIGLISESDAHQTERLIKELGWESKFK